ncbi:MAG: hypothetical protein AB1772_05435 [Candidatus Zixiibacteriota bacterium]
MTSSLDRITAEMAVQADETPLEFIDLINANIRPPSPLTADDVHVRAMFVVSDQVNSFGGRFPADEHGRLAELMIDAPVLVGHRKDKLPVARIFHAITLTRDSVPWVKAYFYWLRSSDNAEQLRGNIDGGIYKECSVAFTFHLPECSICGQDIRRCEHQPLQKYDHDGITENCHFNYRRIERVLEASLVYRGATPNTAISRLLDSESESSLPEVAPIGQTRLTPIADLDLLDRDSNYLVAPHYDGLPLTVCADNGRTLFTGLEGTPLEGTLIDRIGGFTPKYPLTGVLVGYRGKERCPLAALESRLQGNSGAVSRLVFHVYPGQGVIAFPRGKSQSAVEFRMIPYRLADGLSVHRAALEIMTRDGVEIWPLHRCSDTGDSRFRNGYWYRPPELSRRAQTDSSVTLSITGAGAQLIISSPSGRGLTHSPQHLQFDIVDFSNAALDAGRRFLAWRGDVSRRISDRKTALTGRLATIQPVGNGFAFDTTGHLNGRFILHPIRFRGADCFLFYRADKPHDEVRAV